MGKSSEMPRPEVIDYDVLYKITPLFVNDLKIVMGDVPYVDAVKLFNKIRKCKGIMTAASLNEFIREIGTYPFKYVSPIMNVINNKELFSKYFEQVVQEKKEDTQN